MRTRIAVLFSLLGLALACGGRPLEERLKEHPARVIPTGASQIVYVRVGELKANPLATWAYAQARDLPLGQAFVGIVRALELAGTPEHVALGTFSAAQTLATVAVASGQFDPAAFTKGLESAGEPYVEGTHGSWRYLTTGRGEARSYVAFPSPRVLVVASQEDLLKRTLDLVEGEAKSLAEDRAFEPLPDSFAPGLQVWATGFFPTALANSLAAGMQQPAIQLIQALTIKMDSSGGLNRLNALLHCASADAAKANAALLQGLAQQLLQQAMLAGYRLNDLATAVSQSQITLDNRQLDLEIALSDQALAATARTLASGPRQPALSIEDLLPPGAFPVPGETAPPGEPAAPPQ